MLNAARVARPVRRAGRGNGPRDNLGTAPRSDPYTEHPTREGKVYCAVALDTYSRRVVGWSIDNRPSATLVTNALGTAIDQRDPDVTIIHSDQGVQFSFWAFTTRTKSSGLVPSRWARSATANDCDDPRAAGLDGPTLVTTDLVSWR